MTADRVIVVVDAPTRCPRNREPFFLQWHVTKRCNLSCKHCYGDYGAGGDEPDTEECISIIDRYARFLKKEGLRGRIHFTGGEPFLRKDLLSLIKAARKQRLGVKVLSNGTLITSEIASALARMRVQAVQVSIDGIEATHDRLRGREGAWRDAMRGLARLRDAGVSTTASMTVSKLNLDEVGTVLDSCHHERIDRVGFSRLVPWGRGKDLADELLDREGTQELFTDLLRQRCELEGEMDIPPRDPLWQLVRGVPVGACYLARARRTTGGCSIGTGGLALLADGTLLACRRLPIPIGNVHEDELGDIWHNAPLLEELRDRDHLKGRCGPCRYRYHCGGCRAIAYGATGDHLSEDPQCWYEIGGLGTRIRSFFKG